MKYWIRSKRWKFADKDNIDFQVNGIRPKNLGNTLSLPECKTRLLIFLKTNNPPHFMTSGSFQKKDDDFMALLPSGNEVDSLHQIGLNSHS